jgi:hypothetical protein
MKDGRQVYSKLVKEFNEMKRKEGQKKRAESMAKVWKVSVDAAYKRLEAQFQQRKKMQEERRKK